MYAKYISSDGYEFDDECDWARYEVESSSNPYCRAENYGGREPNNDDNESYYDYNDSYNTSCSYKPTYIIIANFKIIHEIEKAILLKGIPDDCWIPKAMIYNKTKNVIKVYSNFDKKDILKQNRII